jgi:hypothetical protein
MERRLILMTALSAALPVMAATSSMITTRVLVFMFLLLAGLVVVCPFKKMLFLSTIMQSFSGTGLHREELRISKSLVS